MNAKAKLKNSSTVQLCGLKSRSNTKARVNNQAVIQKNAEKYKARITSVQTPTTVEIYESSEITFGLASLRNVSKRELKKKYSNMKIARVE